MNTDRLPIGLLQGNKKIDRLPGGQDLVGLKKNPLGVKIAGQACSLFQLDRQFALKSRCLPPFERTQWAFLLDIEIYSPIIIAENPASASWLGIGYLNIKPFFKFLSELTIAEAISKNNRLKDIFFYTFRCRNEVNEKERFYGVQDTNEGNNKGTLRRNLHLSVGRSL
jgi:hypothetical protein